MRFRASALAAVLIAAGASAASAAVSESQFPPHTVADLIAICAPAKDDPLMTGAAAMPRARSSLRRRMRRKGRRAAADAGLPELASFIAWANERPARLEMPAIDGMFIYLAGKYPCPASVVAKRRSR